MANFTKYKARNTNKKLLKPPKTPSGVLMDSIDTLLLYSDLG